MSSIEKCPSKLKPLFEYIEKNKTRFINNLRNAVSIQSVSGDPNRRDEVVKMIYWVVDRLTVLNAAVEVCDIGMQKLPDGTTIKLPPVILASLGNDPKKPTLCIYGHLDVQPANRSDGWLTEPFEMEIKGDRMFGRGTSDDKGPAISWLHVVEAYNAVSLDLPVNLKFCYEGMEESGSDGLDDLLISKKDTFFKDVDYVCISDNYWLGTKKPCITYGLRGLCYFFLQVTCASKDLHSGVFGGCVNEAMSDLIAILNTLVDKDGKILVPKIYDEVEPVTAEEKALYECIDFDMEEYSREIDSPQLLHDNKENLLMARWRYPSLSIHGIEGAFSEPGSKTVIPKSVIGKFSMRLVPNQKPETVEKLFREHIEKHWKIRGSANAFTFKMLPGAASAWRSNPDHPHYEAASKAIQYVFNCVPDFTREGGSIPVALTFQDIIGKNVLLLPMGRSDDSVHSQNEKLDISNYIEGTKLMAAYVYEVGSLGKVV